MIETIFIVYVVAVTALVFAVAVVWIKSN